MIRVSRALRLVLVLLLVAAASDGGGVRTAADGGGTPDAVIHQLRVYEIFDDTRRAFHARFRDHAMRIMGRYGFTIVAMWESRRDDRTEFVYLLEWRDEQTMQRAWAKFLADREWGDIKQATAQAHGRLVGEIQDRRLAATAYSPRRRLTN